MHDATLILSPILPHATDDMERQIKDGRPRPLLYTNKISTDSYSDIRLRTRLGDRGSEVVGSGNSEPLIPEPTTKYPYFV